VTNAEELVLQALPIAAVVAGVVLLVSQCSDPFPSERRSIGAAQQLIEAHASTTYPVSDCRYVRRLSYDEDEVSCLVAGRCNRRLAFAVSRVDALSSNPTARTLTPTAPPCP
jgi:hypothetical protein